MAYIRPQKLPTVQAMLAKRGQQPAQGTAKGMGLIAALAAHLSASQQAQAQPAGKRAPLPGAQSQMFTEAQARAAAAPSQQVGGA